MKQVWRQLDLNDVRLEFVKCQNRKEMFDHLWSLNSKRHDDALVLLWMWWSARNKANAGDKVK